MADNFTVTTQYPGIDSDGGTQTRDVVFVGITTKPHGTYVEFPLLQSIYTAELVHQQATGWANVFELVWDVPFVVGVRWAQQVNQSNQLADVAIVTVESSSGNSAAELTIPYAKLNPKDYKPMIAHLHDQLDAAEAL